MQDRFVDDPAFIHEGEAPANDISSNISNSRMAPNRALVANASVTSSQKKAAATAVGGNTFGMRNMSVTHQVQFR